MGTCFCRIEGRCLNKREFVFHTLNNNYQQWKEDNIPQSSKSPLEWRFSGLFGWRRTDGFASARLKGWKDTIADIKGVSDIWALALCPNKDTLLYPLFWYCIFNDKGYWKSDVTPMSNRRSPETNPLNNLIICRQPISSVKYFAIFALNTCTRAYSRTYF